VLKGVLAKEAQFLQSAIKNSLPADQPAVKEALLAVTNEIAAIDDSIIQDANDKKQAARDARQKIIDANTKALQAFKDQANAIKSAVLDTFDSKTTRIDNARALEDAKKALRVARQIGGPQGIKLATRDFNDAQRAVQRQRIEDSTFRVTEGPKGPTNVLSVGTQNFYITGTNDEKIAQRVAKILKGGGAGAPQQRGRFPGTNPLGQ
jgi:xanthine dehydrogenase molybdopterin-binding subunit B